MSTESLDIKQQRIVAIAALTAAGDMPQLTAALSRGLDAGLTINDIKEILVQLYAYAGFPRSLNSLTAFKSVIEERSRRGVKDERGTDPHPFPIGTDSTKLGTEIQLRLTGAVASESTPTSVLRSILFSRHTCSATSSGATTSISVRES